MMGRIAPGLVASLFALATGIAGAETVSGGMYVTTLPAGADVFVDGIYVGHAPVLVDALLPGHHALTITKTGWIVREVDVTVLPNAVVMASTQLSAGPRVFAGSAAGNVIVRGAPAGATLTIDSNPFTGQSGTAVALSAGPHRITMTTSRGRTTHSFNVLPETTTDVVLVEPHDPESRSAVVAPAEDYLPTDAFSLEGKKIVVRYAGHVVVAHVGDSAVRLDGATVAYGSAPEAIGGKLYLPIQLLEKLTDDTSNGR
ncbi:MAG: PEGA domain-containing protein [Candidatus Eremiobacteraeota bacterium]|nr:PEGA domain-containing protein [Candidatus Eremiobacteraeota bacterium]